MLGWVTLAREGDLDLEGKARAMETIERNARVQKKLIDDLLDVSSIITGNLYLEIKPTNLASVIELAVESVRPAAEAKEVRCISSWNRAHIRMSRSSIPLMPIEFSRLSGIWFTTPSNSPRPVAR
jgi:signal transduction histidine kinase